MTVFVDTTAFFAFIAQNDAFHTEAAGEFSRLLSAGLDMVTSNYVLLETAALVQGRIGIEAVKALEYDLKPAVRIEWIDHEVHDYAVAALLAANRRQLTLVDLTSFTIMRQRGIDTAFTFDQHFAEQGFHVLPS